MLSLILLVNFVVVVADDQRWDAIDATHGLNGGWAMPAVKARIVDQGMRFTNAFNTTPLCSPSRASLLTGLYAHNHGVKNNYYPTGGARVFDDSVTLATLLHDAGYKTGMIGKYMNDYAAISPYIAPGWDEWRIFVKPTYYDYDLNENGVIHHYGKGAWNYATDVLAHRAVSFIQAYAGQPFFLYFAPFSPHEPAIAAYRHDGDYSGVPKWSPPNYDEADVSDKPQWLQALPRLTYGDRHVIRGVREHMLEAGESIDDAVGHILDALDQMGVANDTMVIYISDNGYNWGEHRLNGKNCAYPECTRAPLMIRYPAGIQAGSSSDAIVANIDLPVTIADYAGVPMSEVNGVSLRPILDSTVVSWRDDLLLEHWKTLMTDPRSDMPDYQAVRTNEFMYVDYDDDAQGTELYDFAVDPYALTNKTNDPDYAAEKADLVSRLLRLKDE